MDTEKDLEIPESLRLELEARDRAVPLITARVDRALAEEAATQFAARRPFVRRRRPAWYAAAAAAVVALFFLEPQRLMMNERAGAYADVDGSGRIDIADVLLLARQGDRQDDRQDNRASQAELDAFARQIVALSSAGESS